MINRAHNRPAATRLPAWLARWARRFLAVPAVLALCAGSVDAQAPRSVVNKTTINLPILLDNSVRPHLKEVQLYVKESPTAPWTLKETVSPAQTFFTYRAPGDGEYAFNVVTVDRAGRTVPADVNKEQPALVVVVDMTAPNVNLHVVENTPKGQVVLVEATDPNYDPMKTRFFYQTGDKNFRPLDSLPGTPEQFCIPGQAVLTGMVRVQATDKAGNTTTKEFNINTMTAAAPATGAPGAGSPSGVTPMAPEKGGPGVVMVEMGSGVKHHLTPAPVKDPTPPTRITEGPALPAPTTPDLPSKDRVELVHRVESPSTPPVPPIPPVLDPGTPSKGISVEVPPSSGSGKTITLPPKMEVRDIPSTSKGISTTTIPSTPAPLGASTSKESIPHNCHIANSTRIFLDYQIEAQGASGVGKVEIWLTKDRGQSWQKVGEDRDLKSPAEVTLPGEGVFGVTLVVTNGRGFGGTPPQPGDQADYWVEVDVTRPVGEIMAVRPSGADDGSLVISWNARDKKLHNEPIELSFSATREGPWTPIAKSLKNDGSYRWVPPRDVAAHAFLRMVVTDAAGNASTCQTSEPVALDDLSRPRGRVLGVSTTPRSGTPERIIPTGGTSLPELP